MEQTIDQGDRQGKSRSGADAFQRTVFPGKMVSKVNTFLCLQPDGWDEDKGEHVKMMEHEGLVAA